MIRALIPGARGQVGAEVAQALEGRAALVTHDHATLDLADRDAIRARLRAAKPDLIVNAAAYTAVDRAESQPELARAVNATAPGVLAEEARRLGALLVHFSTDYVFDGTKGTPYVEGDPTHPLSVYGLTKREGEEAIARSGCDHLILRTSWVYAARGRNFLLTMLRLAATQEEIRVVDDQHGAPTSSLQLARVFHDLLLGGEPRREITAGDLARLRSASGLYHATAAGETTWFGFAQAIFAGQSSRRVEGFRMPRLIAIPTREYRTPAVRPAYSVLSNAKLSATLGVRLADWRAGLEETLSRLPS